MLRMFENKSDARVRTHCESFRETDNPLNNVALPARRGGKCFWSAMRLRIAFIGIKLFLRCRDLSKLNGRALPRFSSSILECDYRKIQVIGGVLSENFSRIN